MKFVALIALALGAQAIPNPNNWSQNYCLTDAQAKNIVDNSAYFLAHPDVEAARQVGLKLLAPDVSVYSDSINALRQVPLGTQVYNNQSFYISDTLSTPPIQQINTIAIVHDCSHIAWHWEFIGIGPERVRGFTLQTINSQGKVQMERTEFNSLTWATDSGYTLNQPTSGPYASGGGGE